MLRRAAREPETLFIALDADASAMADASRRAARPTRRGGRANIIFLVAAAEALPGVLAGIADEVTVILPWGSLLATAVDPTRPGFGALTACLAAGGQLTMLVSVTERDGLAGLCVLDEATAHELSSRYAKAGLAAFESRLAVRADVDLLSSGWGRKLGIPERRSAWLFRLR